MTEIDLSKLKFAASGLIPCVVQEVGSKQVLMLAYMNEQSIRISIDEGRTCFYSRSRGELWRKGETSGHVQRLISLTADCDNDALLAIVEQAGAACHTGATSCFFNHLAGDDTVGFALDDLYLLLQQRQELRPEGSYTSYLFDKGREKILKKIGEESAEVLIAAMKDDRPELIYELADLAYHSLVLMCEAGITTAEIRTELASRHVIDHKVKQEKMK